ncbi:hypothetical protein YSY43_21850 [Paenibacillus sp. YSY-4.3]
MKALRVISATILFIIAAIFFILFMLDVLIPELEDGGIFIIIAVVFFVGGLLVKGKSKAALARQAKKMELKKLGLIVSTKLHHVAGLPITQYTYCDLYLTKDNLTVVGGGTTFNLAIHQIRAVEVKTDIEMTQIITLGEIVRGKAEYYLNINYSNSFGGISTLMFNGGRINWKVNKIANKIKPLITENNFEAVQL